METLEEFEKNVKKCKTNDGFATYLMVTVITACGSLGTKINIVKLYKFLIRHVCSIKMNSKKIKLKGRRVLDMVDYLDKMLIFTCTIGGQQVEFKYGKKNAFYNCLNVKYTYTDSRGVTSTIASKIFPNGSLSIPGCRSIEAVKNGPEVLYEIMSEVVEKYKKFGENPLEYPKNFKLGKTRIAMINSNFSFNKSIYQEKLKDAINANRFDGVNDKPWRVTNFQPENYSGVNIRYLTKKARENFREKFLKKEYVPYKVEGQVSVFIFKSGKGTIAGANNTMDLLETYEAIVDFVRNNENVVKEDDVECDSSIKKLVNV